MNPNMIFWPVRVQIAITFNVPARFGVFVMGVVIVIIMAIYAAKALYMSEYRYRLRLQASFQGLLVFWQKGASAPTKCTGDMCNGTIRQQSGQSHQSQIMSIVQATRSPGIRGHRPYCQPDVDAKAEAAGGGLAVTLTTRKNAKPTAFCFLRIDQHQYPAESANVGYAYKVHEFIMN